MAELARESALAALTPDGARAYWQCADLQVEELPKNGLLRVQVASGAALPGLIAGLVPPAPGRFHSDRGLRCAWLAPRDWLLFCPAGSEMELADTIAAPALCSVISDARVAIAIRGARARELLACATGFDVHEQVFGLGACVSTRFAQLPVVLLQSGVEPAFELLVDRAHAAWLWNWLVDIAGEFAPADDDLAAQAAYDAQAGRDSE